MDDKLKKAEQVALDAKAKIDAEAKAAEAKKEAETKGAAKEVKTEGDKSILENAEKQAENDARILSAKDEELSDVDKIRKAELIKIKADKEKEEEAKLSVEDKIKRTQESTQKRIDEVIGELKAEKAERQQDKKKIADLEAELQSLKQPKVEEDKATKAKQLEQQQISKYLEEDKSKPREQRREMTKEEISDWLLEDFEAAQEWLTERALRRKDDKEAIARFLDDTPKKLAEEFVKKQAESLQKLVAKYPDIKTKDSADYTLMMEIINADQKKYVESANGPELVMEEMDKRKVKSKKTITLTEEELAEKIKEAASAEAQRLAGLDEGLSSGGMKRMDKQEKKSEMRLKQEAIARKAGIPIEKLDARIKEREKMNIPLSVGAGEFDKD